MEQSSANVKKVIKFGRNLYQGRQSVPSEENRAFQGKAVSHSIIDKDQSIEDIISNTIQRYHILVANTLFLAFFYKSNIPRLNSSHYIVILFCHVQMEGLIIYE